MSRGLSWSEQFHALLSNTDGYVARIKQRLYPRGVSTTESGVQAQQSQSLKTTLFPEKLSWDNVPNASSLWDEVTFLKSQLRSQAEATETLKLIVQNLLDDREHQKSQIRSLEDQHLEKLKRDLQDLRNQEQELARTQVYTRTGKCCAPRGCHRELHNEPELLWNESEAMREKQKLFGDQLSQHQGLLPKQIIEGQPSQIQSRKVLEQLQSGQEESGHMLEETKTAAQYGW